MLRAPMSLEKMTYDAATGTVIYRSKMHAGLKRNFQVMPGEEPASESAARAIGLVVCPLGLLELRWRGPCTNTDRDRSVR